MKKRQIGVIKQRKSYREWQREWFGRWMKNNDTGEDREYKGKKKMQGKIEITKMIKRMI